MRKAHQVLAIVLAAFVVIQAMAIAYALAGLGKWIEDGHTLNAAVKKQLEDGDVKYRGVGGFALHGIDGQLIIPIITILLLIFSLLAAKQVPGAGTRGGIIFVMVIVQIVLGMSAEDAPFLAPIHALNGFGIFAMAVVTARKAAEAAPATTEAVAV